MDSELAAATSFLSAYLPAPLKAPFSALLHSHLADRYAGHWHPADPERGSAFRALVRNGGRIDHSLVHAGSSMASGELELALSGSGGRVPLGERWTLWVDPGCVSLRVERMDGASPGVGREGQFIEIYGKLPESLSSHAIPLDAVTKPSLNRAVTTTTTTISASTPPAPVTLAAHPAFECISATRRVAHLADEAVVQGDPDPPPAKPRLVGLVRARAGARARLAAPGASPASDARLAVRDPADAIAASRGGAVGRLLAVPEPEPVVVRFVEPDALGAAATSHAELLAPVLEPRLVLEREQRRGRRWRLLVHRVALVLNHLGRHALEGRRRLAHGRRVQVPPTPLRAARVRLPGPSAGDAPPLALVDDRRRAPNALLPAPTVAQHKVALREPALAAQLADQAPPTRHSRRRLLGRAPRLAPRALVVHLVHLVC